MPSLSLFNALLQAIAILDVISSIDLFSKLSLTHGREVLQIAKRGKYQVGEVVNTYKSWSEKFYVVAAGVVEARVNVGEDGTYDDSAENVRGSIGGSSVVRFSGGSFSGGGGGSGSGGSDGESNSGSGGSNESKGESNEKGETSGGEPVKKYKVLQRYVTGDYFGEEGVLNLPPRKVDFVASQQATLVEFEKADFQWLLEGTKIMERMLHLIEMRKENIVSIIQENSVLRNLTLSQITQFEEYLFRYEVKKGTFIWQKGDKADRAFIVESGCVKFDAPIPRSRRPSEMHVGRSNSMELAKALQTALSEAGNGGGSGGEQKTKIAPKPKRTAKPIATANSFRVPPLSRGAFVADTDSLLGGQPSSVGVVASEDSTLLMIDRKDLIIFFSNNPGVRGNGRGFRVALQQQ